MVTGTVVLLLIFQNAMEAGATKHKHMAVKSIDY
jgi:hypothetical protein